MGEAKLRLLHVDVKTEAAEMHSMGGLTHRVVTSRYLTLECEVPTGDNKMSPELVVAMARGDVEIVVRKITPDETLNKPAVKVDSFGRPIDMFGKPLELPSPLGAFGKKPPKAINKDAPASQEPAW